MPNLFPIRARILSAPTSKRLTNLSCLELRKEIQEASRKNLRMNMVWDQFMYEVCHRVSKYTDKPVAEKVDKFTPTDISLIFSSFSVLKKNNKQFYNYLLECINTDIDTYSVRDIAVLYNSLTKLNISNQFIFDSLNKVILNKLNNKISEKDISLLLNGILELNIDNPKDIFIKCSLILSSRIKYISNLHTLTLLLHSYSRLSYIITDDSGDINFNNDNTNNNLSNNNSNSSGSTILLDNNNHNKNQVTMNNFMKMMVNNYEYIILTDVTTSILSKCSDLLLEMRPTDLLYFYRSFLNLYFSCETNKRNIYSNIVKLYKTHNQILKLKLEFQTRELIVLFQLLSESFKTISSTDFLEPISNRSDSSNNNNNINNTTNSNNNNLSNSNESSDITNNSSSTILLDNENESIDNKENNKEENENKDYRDETSLEMYKNSPRMIKEIKDELVYRIKLMSLVDCLNLMKILKSEDQVVELVFRRIYDKLNRENVWENYSNNDLLTTINKISERAKICVSDDSKLLLKVAINRISKFLKLKDLCKILEISSILGIKSNSLERKIRTVICRSDSLEDDQLFIIFHSSVSLGYLEILDSLLEKLYRIKDEKQSVELLMDLTLLRFNCLKSVDQELVNHLYSNIKNKDGKFKEQLKYLSYFDMNNNTDTTNNNLLSNNTTNGSSNSSSTNKTSTTSINNKDSNSSNNTNKSSNKILLDNKDNENKSDSDSIELSLDFDRIVHNYMDRNFNVVNYKEFLNEFINDFNKFISKHDPESKLKENSTIKSIVFPASLEIKSRELAIIPLFDDFYETNTKMLKLRKYTFLKLLEHLEINYICFDLYKYYLGENKTNMLANLLQQSYVKIENNSNKNSKEDKNNDNNKNNINNIENNNKNKVKEFDSCKSNNNGSSTIKGNKANSFERLRSMISAHL